MWTAEDQADIRPPAAQWLIGLRESGTKTLLLFSEGDDGIVFLRDRIGYRLEQEADYGALRIVEHLRT